MEWTQRDGVWTSGPYSIELIEAGKWALARQPGEPASSRIEMDGPARAATRTWTGRSLKALKAKAESLEASSSRRHARNRHLAVLLGAGLLFFLVCTASGQIAALLAVGSAGLALHALVRSIDASLSRRPWDSLRQTLQ